MFLFWQNGLIDLDDFYFKSFLPARDVFRKSLDEISYVWVPN